MSMQDDCEAFAAKIERLAQDVFVASAMDVHASVVFGSDITGAPGQPVDTGYLAASWILGWGTMPSFPLSGEGVYLTAGGEWRGDPAWGGGAVPQIATAPVGVPDRAFVVTNTVYAPDQEDNTRGARQLSTVGGHHSVKLTRAGWQRIVDHNTRRLAS